MNSLKIALLGYGKMGREIEYLAQQRGHSVILKVNSQNVNELTVEALRGCDVAIEFSRPDAVVANINCCFEADLPIVIGTTGWYSELDQVIKLCDQGNQTLFYASNFSIGVNIFFEINRKLAQLMNKIKEYDVSITEIHHTEKLDKPSGTAISIANQVIESVKRKKKWVVNQEASDVSELIINAKREDSVIGKHMVHYYSPIDEIIIQHNAFSRKGFAEGALMAAEYIYNRKGVFTMQHIMQ